jgi:alkylhydroperoxidase family enzyme
MARLPYVDPEKASEPVRDALQALPVPLKIFGMMAHAESSFRPLLRLGASILGGQLLDAKLRELAILQAAKLTPGEYEWIQHVPIARATGASEAQIEALARGDYDADCFDEDERLVLHFGADTLRGARVSDERFAAMKERFSAREIVELILALGYYSMLSRLTEVTATDHDAPSGTKVVDSLADAE